MANETNINFVDITKGYRRLGNFPAFSDEVFSTYEEAEDYANKGLTADSNAYIGQVVRVLPEGNINEPTAYIIDRNYRLVSVTETVATESKLSVEFDYSTDSGSSAIRIVVPAGFVLNSISVKLIEGFMNDNALSVGSYKFALADGEIPEITYYLASGTSNDIASIYGTDNIIITDESDSEFTVKSTVVFQEKSNIVIFINKLIDPLRRGHGILKLN